jgi:hypothetical protein
LAGCGDDDFLLDVEKFKVHTENWWNVNTDFDGDRLDRVFLDDYDAIIQCTNKIIKSKECVELGLATHMVNNVSIRNGNIFGDMRVKTYTDEEFVVYHEGLKTILKFRPEMLPKISYDGESFYKLFDSEMVSTINPKFKPDTLVQLIRDPEVDFNDTEDDITGLCYIEKYDDDLEGFSVIHIQKKLTGIENRPYTLIAPSRFFTLTELSKYLFKVINVDFGKIRDKSVRGLL